jgi:hypothetical protein
VTAEAATAENAAAIGHRQSGGARGRCEESEQLHLAKLYENETSQKNKYRGSRTQSDWAGEMPGSSGECGQGQS